MSLCAVAVTHLKPKFVEWSVNIRSRYCGSCYGVSKGEWRTIQLVHWSVFPLEFSFGGQHRFMFVTAVLIATYTTEGAARSVQLTVP